MGAQPSASPGVCCCSVSGEEFFCSYFILRKLSGLSICVNELLCINLQMFSCI